MQYILIKPDMWGNMSKEQVEEHKPRIFPCGKCSIEGFEVYHGLLGAHTHVSNDKLREMLKSVDLLNG